MWLIFSLDLPKGWTLISIVNRLIMWWGWVDEMDDYHRERSPSWCQEMCSQASICLATSFFTPSICNILSFNPLRIYHLPHRKERFRAVLNHCSAWILCASFLRHSLVATRWGRSTIVLLLWTFRSITVNSALLPSSLVVIVDICHLDLLF